MCVCVSTEKIARRKKKKEKKKRCSCGGELHTWLHIQTWAHVLTHILEMDKNNSNSMGGLSSAQTNKIEKKD